MKKKRKQVKIQIQKLTSIESNLKDNIFVVDFVKVGFKKAFLQLSYIFRFVRKLQHKVHMSKGETYSDHCKTCTLSKEFQTKGLDCLMIVDPKGFQPVVSPS